MRKTKIICTIGPASDSIETLKQLCLNGMNVARLNFSHGTHEGHLKTMERIKAVRAELGLPIAIMLDTKGPEYRIKTFKNDRIVLKDGDIFTFTTDDIVGDETRVAVSYDNLPNELNVDDIIYLCNGLVSLKVIEIVGNDIKCEVLAGGEVSNKKTMNFPNKTLRAEYLSQQDKDDILFGIQNGVDFIAASFVSRRSDVEDIRRLLDSNNGRDVAIIAKIENRFGVDNIDDICEVADGIMVARGDLGVEIPYVEVPSVQKYLISKCRLLGKLVITATEMLESMIHNPRPTRAEISDVANAVYDGSSAVMLSGESAAGKYPVEAVHAMAEICQYTELHIDYKKVFRDTDFRIKNNIDAISHATCAMAIDVDAKCIVANSMTGITVRMVSRFRCPADIIGITVNERAWRQLNLSWGVTPVMSDEYSSQDVMFYQGFNQSKVILKLKPGDNVVLTGGLVNGHSGNTDTIKLLTV